jgi:hypothetical protein
MQSWVISFHTFKPIRCLSKSCHAYYISMNGGDPATSYTWTGRSFKALGKLTIILRGIHIICLKSIRENWKSTCNQLDLETLGSRSAMPKNLHGHCYIYVSRERGIVVYKCTSHSSNIKALKWYPTRRLFCLVDWKMSICNQLDLENTGISIGYAQKSPWTLLHLC